jgi:type I restriction enzyme M protein
MVELIKPQAGELVQDPAAGTGGFLIASDRYIRRHTSDLFDLSEAEQSFHRHQAFYGIELVQDAHRLLLMNMLLHGIEGAVELGDTLSGDGQQLPKANVVLTNPPFGTKKGGGLPTRDDFTFPTSNKQLAFLQHIYRGLLPGGRAAVVLPDNVLFEDGVGRSIRADLMDKCNLHTILRLPTGIFYAQGVKTNVLFFQRGTSDKGNTKQVWFYDMRTNMPSFGKRIPLSREHFQEFEQCYGDDPNGNSPRVDLGEDGRFRCFRREQITKRNENLDISWLRDESLQSGDNLPEPEVIAAEIMEKLRIATKEMEALMILLEGEEAAEAVSASVGMPTLE